MVRIQKTVSYSKFIDLINKKRLLETFFELLRIKSPSRDEKQIADYISDILRSLGLTVITDDAGKKIGSNAGNIIALLASNCENGATRTLPLFFGAHLDTVSVNGDIKPEIRDKKIVLILINQMDSLTNI